MPTDYGPLEANSFFTLLQGAPAAGQTALIRHLRDTAFSPAPCEDEWSCGWCHGRALLADCLTLAVAVFGRTRTTARDVCRDSFTLQDAAKQLRAGARIGALSRLHHEWWTKSSWPLSAPCLAQHKDRKAPHGLDVVHRLLQEVQCLDLTFGQPAGSVCPISVAAARQGFSRVMVAGDNTGNTTVNFLLPQGLVKDLLRLREVYHAGNSPYFGAYELPKPGSYRHWRIPPHLLSCQRNVLPPLSFVQQELAWQLKRGLVDRGRLQEEMRRIRSALARPAGTLRALLREPVTREGHASLISLLSRAHICAQPFGRFRWLATTTHTTWHERLSESPAGDCMGLHIVEFTMRSWDAVRTFLTLILAAAPFTIWQQPAWRQLARSIMSYPGRALLLHIA